MREPDNHTVLIDSDCDTWVRFDEWPGRYGMWRSICTGPGWDSGARDRVGPGTSWGVVERYGPLEGVNAAYAKRLLRQVEEAFRND